VTTEAPDFAAAAAGYRWWGVRDGRLASPNVITHTWVPGVNHAHCIYGNDHDAPSEDYELCECGLYAWAEDVCEPHHAQAVVGVVCLWGRMQVAVGAVRAEHAKIMALAGEAWAEEIAEEYGVPLVERADLPLHAEASGALSIPRLYKAATKETNDSIQPISPSPH